jgi:gliding motility-associated-like protein
MLCIFFFSIITTSAQESKRNNNWYVGFSPVVNFDFNNQILQIDTTQNLTGLTFGASCISDTNGNALFFCNGFYMYDKNATPLEYPNGNFDSINCPLGTKFRDYYHGDGFFNQMSIILPKKDNQYYVFTSGMSDVAYDDWKVAQTDFRFDVLSYHIVDMDANAGAGKVVSKNNILMKDARLSHNRMTAVRHANGRDWWLIKPHRNLQTFYIFRLTPDSILGPTTQSFPFYLDSIPRQFDMYGLQGQCAFSPDGNWFASTEATQYGSVVYRFDRCSGQLKYYNFFKLPIIDSQFNPLLYDHTVGVCFSPNSKLLYLNSIPNIWQYELSDTSLNSGFHISGPDTLLGNFPEYYSSYLAPNGHIYIGAWHGSLKSMPFIENPDVRGLGCNFRGRGNGAFSQPYTNLNVPPNLPFYGLGKLEGSPCDTIKPYIEPPPPVTSANILVPNAISPNGDGKNDTWHILDVPQIQQAGITLQAVGVYNRWGNEVFKSNDINFVWKPSSNLASDTYYFYIRYRTKVGTSQVMKGSVSVVR